MLLKRIDAFLGRFFYKNSNLFSYNLYRTIYKKYICNLKMLSNKNINDYYQEGCCKIASANQLYIKNLNSLRMKKSFILLQLKPQDPIVF